MKPFRFEALEDRYEVQCWVVSQKGRAPVHAFCEKRGGGLPMHEDSPNNDPLTKMPPSVLDHEFPSTPGKVDDQISFHIHRNSHSEHTMTVIAESSVR